MGVTRCGNKLVGDSKRWSYVWGHWVPRGCNGDFARPVQRCLWGSLAYVTIAGAAHPVVAVLCLYTCECSKFGLAWCEVVSFCF